MEKAKIIIAGIGGVGGYFGGLMAHHFEHDPSVEIHFLARGEHLKQIQANGLILKKGSDQWRINPSSATDNPAEIGIADYLILCTKTYDLESVIEQLRPSINHETIILPLLNGVNNQAVIQKLLPNNLVVNGCVYIVSRLKKAGFVENSGNIQKLFFGQQGVQDKRLDFLADLILAASIESTFTSDIERVIWEKYIFLSPTATVTSYYDRNIGEVLAESDSLSFLQGLIEEVRLLAEAKQFKVAADITEKTLTKLRSLPFETTSSMHSDFIAQKPFNELESLTHYVVKEGLKHQVKTPNYQIAYHKLK